ncbi:hypothetical protein [Botryobacter ruber]|uniref:hypothetical protein n=1 Tax=Botryobacter ruber TaxID=2171629 RepID=UPI000FEC4015|nr:hypothetical protein [Botryobacter ruber]
MKLFLRTSQSGGMAGNSGSKIKPPGEGTILLQQVVPFFSQPAGGAAKAMVAGAEDHVGLVVL